MSLINTITRSVASASVKGHKVAKRWSNILQLNLNLKIERDRQKAYYKAIGEHVHIDKVGEVASSPKIKELREKIFIQERKITQLVEAINNLKSINSCPNCSYISKDAQKYCPNCSRLRK